MLTPFIFKDIILERWKHEFYFVQSMETGKWGALKYTCEYSDNRNRNKNKRPDRVFLLKEVLHMEYDEIYEDQICTDCSPTLFWVFRKGEKLGILTPSHHSEALYDGYDTDCEKCSFILYKDGEKTNMNYGFSF